MNIRTVVLSVAVCAATLAASPVYATDLAEVYARALQNDPQIREAEANRLAALEAKPQALASLLPQVTASAGYQNSKVDSAPSTFSTVDPTTGNFVSFNADTHSSTDSKTWDVTLRESIFRWENWVTRDQADKQAAKAEIDYHAAQQNLILRTAQTYFNVLAAKDTLTAAEATFEAVSRQLEQAQKRFEVGLIAITDVQDSKAAYDAANADVIQAKRDLATQEEYLRELTGETFDTLSKPGPNLPLEAPDPKIAADWVKLAMDQNLALASSRMAAEITRDNISLQRGGHYPSLDLVVSRGNQDLTGTRRYTFTNAQNQPESRSFSTPNNSDTTMVGLQLTVPIYSGGATSSRVRQAEYLHRAARERLEATARQTERDTRDAYLGVISEMSRVKALQQSVESAKVALQATEAGYEVGTRTTVDVLNARYKLYTAETNYARSRYDYLINVIQLKLAAGTLDPNEVAEINSKLNETVSLKN